MQIASNSHSPPPGQKKQHLKLHVQPIQLPDANVLNKTVGNSDPDIGGKIIKTERITGFKQSKKFHIKQIQVSANNRLQTNNHKMVHQENDGISLILYKQSQTSNSDKIITKQLVNDLRAKIDQQDSVIRLQEFKISRLQQELYCQKLQCQNLISKLSQNDTKNQYFTQLKTPKILPTILDNNHGASVQPSLIKINTNNDQNKMKQLQITIQLLQKQQSELKNYVQEMMNKMKLIIQTLSTQISQKIIFISKEYQDKIQSIENLFAITNQFNKENISQVSVKFEILCQELVMSEAQKENYYLKCLSLLS